MDYFIDDYFSDLINKIDLKREELKLDIDNFYDKHIEDLKMLGFEPRMSPSLPFPLGSIDKGESVACQITSPFNKR